MLIIQFVAPDFVQTVQIDHGVGSITVELRPCLYCGEIVQLPRKFCCDSHKTLYSRYHPAS